MKLTEAVEYFGSKTALAKAINVGKSAVTLWGDQIPQGRQYQIEILTKGKLKADPVAA